jgi:L-idonate 5-dehydrogenase
MMKACVLHAPNDLRIEDVETPLLGPSAIAIRIGAGGICGSDLHYYQHGGFGTVRISQPMILGHEVAGVVSAIGTAVTRVHPGDRVAVNPNQPCGKCQYCLAGRANLCLDVQFYGSAMRFPHVQGAFRQELIADEAQAFPVPPGTDLAEAAFAEPLAVTLHAVTRATSVAGRRVVVMGCGPIGALAIAASRRFGAREIVAVDVARAPLRAATEVGADRTINSAEIPDDLAAYQANKGYFDVLLECSGNDRALRSGLEVVHPGGTIVQLGLGGDITLPMNAIVTKELELRGSFRFHEEFGWAVDFIARRQIDVRPLLTEVVPFAEADRAFALAADRNRAMKVQLSFA